MGDVIGRRWGDPPLASDTYPFPKSKKSGTFHFFYLTSICVPLAWQKVSRRKFFVVPHKHFLRHFFLEKKVGMHPFMYQ